MDSDRNCTTSCFLIDPITFLIPTSRALRAACAVDKLVKFTQASNNIKKASAEKIYIY